MSNKSVKQKVLEVGRVVGGVVCVFVGLAISGFGITQLLPQRKYAEIPEREDEN